MISPPNLKFVAMGPKRELIDSGVAETLNGVHACEREDPFTLEDIEDDEPVVIFKSLPRALHEPRFYCFRLDMLMTWMDQHDERWEGYNRWYNDPNPPPAPGNQSFMIIPNPNGRPYNLPIPTDKFFDGPVIGQMIRAWRPRAARPPVIAVHDSDEPQGSEWNPYIL